MTYPTATVGGVAAFVGFAGLAPGFIGLYQVNVQVPQGVAAGDACRLCFRPGPPFRIPLLFRFVNPDEF